MFIDDIYDIEKFREYEQGQWASVLHTVQMTHTTITQKF
jgi:hypothetical protein